VDLVSKKPYTWLPHLENSLPKSARGYTVSLYSIALEAWRRGLELTFIQTKASKSNSSYTLSDGKDTYRFSSTRGERVTREAIRTCVDKMKTKTRLLNAGVPTPKGKEFAEQDSEKIIVKYAEELGYPLVIKPVKGTGGKGVIANIGNKPQLKRALKYVRQELDYPDIIVEEFFEGEDYRVYVLDGRAIAATKRISANVIGDGKSTIKKLIKEKNKHRRDLELYRTSLIKIDSEVGDMLERVNYTLDSVPAKDERVFLKSKNNITAGGDPVDSTDELPEEVKQIAVDAANAIPNLVQAGVDLMYNGEKATIIEINSRPNIRLNLFPLEGKARDIPKEIVDYYFPNSKANQKSPLYFDFGPIWRKLKSGEVKEYKVPNLPKGNLKLTRFRITGNIQRTGYGSWVKKHADQLGVSGYINHFRSGHTSLVICGTEEKIKQFKEVLQKDHSNKWTVKKISEKSRITPVPIGFEIKNKKRDRSITDGYFPVRLKS